MKTSIQNRTGVELCRRAALSSVIVLATALLAVASAQAQNFTYQVLHQFAGAPEAGNSRGFILDAQGNLYGTSSKGGTFNLGTVFKLDITGTETVLHSFSGTGGDGATPDAGVVMDAQGNLYGSTSVGGDLSCRNPTGCGIVFKLDPAGNETILHAFTGTGDDGANPSGDLVLDAQGNIYGTTSTAGANFAGTIFKLNPSGVETVLHAFTCCSQAAAPEGLVMDASGNFFGTTRVGGPGHGRGCGPLGCGTVYVLTKGGSLFTLHSFDPSNGDGGHPNRRLVLDAQGNLYGTTFLGGFPFKGRPIGSGTAFKVDAQGNETLLHVFCVAGHDANVATPLCPDGAFPAGGLAMDGAGNLFGTTEHGGSMGGHGTIFMIDSTGHETVLHNFAGFNGQGAYPATDLLMDSQGDLYGTAGVAFGMLTPAAATVTTLTSSLNPSTFGETATFTAVVSTRTGAPPDGETVSFIDSRTLLGTATLSGGSASFSSSTLPVGIRKITAVYGGDPHLIGSSNVLLQRVKKAPPSVQ